MKNGEDASIDSVLAIKLLRTPVGAVNPKASFQWHLFPKALGFKGKQQVPTGRHSIRPWSYPSAPPWLYRARQMASLSRVAPYGTPPFFQSSPAGSQVKRSRPAASNPQPMLAPSLATEAQGPRGAASFFISRAPGTRISEEPAGLATRGERPLWSLQVRPSPPHPHLRFSELRPSPGLSGFPAPPPWGPQASALPVTGCQVTHLRRKRSL